MECHPGTSDWNTAANWTTSTVPTATDIAQFNTSTTTTIDIRQANTQVGGLQFNTGAPAYIFNVTGTAGVASSLIVSGSGVADISGNAPTFVVSGVAGALGTLQFTELGYARRRYHPHPGVRPDDFLREQHGALARFITDAGGLVDFSGTSGPSGNNRITAGSIEGAGTYNLGGNTLIVGLNGLSTTVSGTINDGGASGGIGASLVKLGAGTLVLSGDNTYTGLTAILAGTLQLGDGGTSGSILGNVFDHTTLAVNRSDTYTYAGRIIGDGAVVQTGPGTTILTGNNLYLGGTTISAGTLQLGNGGTSGSIIGDVVDNGIFAINRSDTYSFGGAISGSGAVVQIGPGTTILTGTNSYSGGTAINAGVLAVSADANLGAAAGGLAFNGGTLQFLSGFTTSRAVTLNAGGGAFDTNGNSATLAGAIGGSGGLSKIGAGTLTLTGASSYSGATAVNAGALVVNGSIANSAVTVNAGAVLSGVGTVGATTINSGGTFAPGNSPGTMTVAGNLAFQSGALYLVQINPSTASSANAITGGSAALAGTVNAAFASGSYVSRTLHHPLGRGRAQRHRVRHLDHQQSADRLHRQSQLHRQRRDPEPHRQPGRRVGRVGHRHGRTQRQPEERRQCAQQFLQHRRRAAAGFVAVFGLTGGNLGNALSQLSGEPATGSQQVGFQIDKPVSLLMLDPFVDGRSGIAGATARRSGSRRNAKRCPRTSRSRIPRCSRRPHRRRRACISVGAFGARPTAAATARAATRRGREPRPVRHAPRDLPAGSTIAFRPETRWWAWRSPAAAPNWSLAQGLGGGRSDAFQAGLYGATRSGPAYLGAALAYTNHWMSTDRFAFAGDHLTASFNAQSLGARVESGYRLASMFGGFTPYVAIQAQYFRTPSYSETDLNGGGFGARLQRTQRNRHPQRARRSLRPGGGSQFRHRARVARAPRWAHDWVSDPALAPVFQALPGASFIVNGAAPARNSALVSAGSELQFANGISILGKFDGEFAARSSTYAGTGTVRYRW